MFPIPMLRQFTRSHSRLPSRDGPVPHDKGSLVSQHLCHVNAAALDKLPAHTGDKSGIGVHYVDAYLKPMNAKLPDGTPVKCKRRGLKIVLTVGTQKGEGLMRRLALGPDPVVMLAAALQEAATAAGVKMTLENGAVGIIAR